MPSHALLLLALASAVAADYRSGPSPLNVDPTDTSNPVLVGKRFPYTDIPYQADTTTSERGSQYGYNRCNSTTEGQSSLCQTAIINSLDDFCLWGPPKANVPIGDSESYEVAWCTKPTHGARLIPAGALTGVQFIKTPSYVQITGRLNQELLNLPTGDYGGELDSGGQDGRGNPIGGLVYAAQLPGGTTDVPAQAASWHNFIGGDVFCFKACDPNAANAVGLCQHIYDRIGCAFNAPADYTDGVFLSCLGDDQDPVGLYTLPDGSTTYYKQPAESLGAVTTMPYVAKLPATSSCTTHSSAELYSGLPTVSGSLATSTGTSSSSSSSGSKANSASASSPQSSQAGAGVHGRHASLAGVLAAAIFGAAYGA
ncbi:hypothetical protein EXIGLDRAFT_770653 [Exidia glandulosa HHB12029]|uniref:Macrofage activating glyco protein n=1 Tax=Exidia glandulosa HHB12029 TaxID=1314781 RepID=A0A165GJ55_EXIGL|nr:hypothetical protein EXIGLDRAFT_770653 [Exidia glandulosa HHB12029]